MCNMLRMGWSGEASPRSRELALAAITMIWGATFLVVHIAMEHSGPLFFVGLRFLSAGLVSCLIFERVLGAITRREVLAGGLIGVTIVLGYGLQTYGLQTIDSSTSAFITALYIPMVPLILWVVTRRAPGWATVGGVLLAFGGLVVLAGPGATGVSLGRGEVATLISAVAIAAEIILIGAFAGTVHIGRVTCVQLLVGGSLALLLMPATAESVPEFSWVWLLSALGLGVASCLIQVTMNWAQTAVSPTKASLIYAGEPVWGGIFGRLAGDRLPATAIVGAAMIVAGVVVSEIKPRASTPTDDHQDSPTPSRAAPRPSSDGRTASDVSSPDPRSFQTSATWTVRRRSRSGGQ